MLFKTKDRNKLKRLISYLLFAILVSVSFFYIKVLPERHWTMIVPWSLTAIFFIAWRWTVRGHFKKSITRRKIKKYI